jgi:hypothetical protein
MATRKAKQLAGDPKNLKLLATESGAGPHGCFASAYYDYALSKIRILVGYVGEDGILPDTPYGIVDGKWKQVSA